MSSAAARRLQVFVKNSIHLLNRSHLTIHMAADSEERKLTSRSLSVVKFCFYNLNTYASVYYAQLILDG